MFQSIQRLCLSSCPVLCAGGLSTVCPCSQAPKRSSSYLVSSPEPGPVELPAPRYSESSLKKKRVYWASPSTDGSPGGPGKAAGNPSGFIAALTSAKEFFLHGVSVPRGASSVPAHQGHGCDRRGGDSVGFVTWGTEHKDLGSWGSSSWKQ